MNTRRKGIPKSIRFEVFKRDKFTCQYCGKSAPDVILEIDHIQPVCKDGDNDIMNLITSCMDCNRGKSGKQFTDNELIKKQKQQLDELQERRNQLKLLLAWKKELSIFEKETIDEISDHWLSITGWVITDSGKGKLAEFIHRYGITEVVESINISISTYGKPDKNGNISKENIQSVFDYIPRICNTRRMERERPYMKELFYIRGILRNRGLNIKPYYVIDLLEKAYKEGIEYDTLKSIAINSKNWTEWRVTMEDLCQPAA